MKTRLYLAQAVVLLAIGLLFAECNNTKNEACDELNLYAGIEISATSIKKTLLRRDEIGDFKALTDTKTKQLNFSDNNEIDDGELTMVKNELESQFESIARRCIAKERIYIAFSSGLENIKGLKKLKDIMINDLEFPEENLESLDYHIETVSGMKSCRHNLSEGELLFIDIGGSNTKIGVYDKSNSVYISEEISFGTRSLEEAIRKEVGDIPTFDQINKMGKKILHAEIVNKFKSNAALNGKTSILFVGGTPYNLVDNIYKNRAEGKLVTLNFSGTKEDDLNSYRSAIEDGSVVIPGHLKYNREELYAGHVIMRELWEAAGIDVVYFIDQVSWMPGFVKYKVNQ